MRLLYLLAVKSYGFAILIASLWNPKAAKFIKGRKKLFKKISKAVSSDDKIIWVHCSSLGEYEQGKPLIKKIKQQFEEHKIFLTLFSPSGYEHLNNNSVADFTFYLPLDSPKSARRFLKLLKPEFAIFIKYEYWYYYLKELNKRKIPAYVVSCIFRPNMRFFKWYGSFFSRMLHMVDHFFVQDEKSQNCLYDNQLTHVSVSGDTRFDTVWNNSLNVKPDPIIERFISNSMIILGGSTWHEDERLLSKYISETDLPVKMILAPHEINEQHLRSIEKKCTVQSVRYSAAVSGEDIYNAKVLVIDNIGMLPSLYVHATVAFIGGGFGSGIHNILEAAVFGNPIVFGPKYSAFREAQYLVKHNGAFAITNYTQLKTKLDYLLKDVAAREQIQQLNKKYILKNKGASDVITNFLIMNSRSSKKMATP